MNLKKVSIFCAIAACFYAFVPAPATYADDDDWSNAE